MSVRRLFSKEPLGRSGEVMSLDPSESHHGAHVLRLRPGDGVWVFDARGRQFEATVESGTGDRLRLRLGAPTSPAPETRMPLALYLALVKGGAFESALQRAVELGAREIVPVITRRSVPQAPAGEDLADKMARWRQVLLSATKQCGRARLTDLAPPCAFEAAIGGLSGETIGFCCVADPEAPRLSERLRAVDFQAYRSVAVLIGPEGGLEPEEIAHARRCGWETVHLGPRILRVETAVASALTLILAALGET